MATHFLLTLITSSVSHRIVTTAKQCPSNVADICIPCKTVLEADVRRTEYLATRGGLYLDTDVSIKKPPQEWPTIFGNLPWDSASLIVGVEFPRPVGTGPDGCCLQFVNWAMMARQGSQILHEVATTGRKAINRGAREQDAVHATGPGCLTRVLMRHIGSQFNLNDVERSGAAYTSVYTNEIVIVLPYRAFGVHPAHTGNHINKNPIDQQLVRHGFRGSWRTR